MSLIDVVNKSFGNIKKKDPGKANKISSTSSGEPFGLYADTDTYRTSKTIDIEFDEDGNLITDIEHI